VSRSDPTDLYEFEPGWGEPGGIRLDRPVLVVALEGWVDAGMGASAAIAHLLTGSPTATVATFDTEPLIDQRARRPIARLEDGVTTELTWPTIRLLAGKDRVGADLLYLTGPEPDFRWRSFIEAVVGITGRLDVRTVVGFGAFPRPRRTPGRCAWPRRSRPSRPTWRAGWAPCTAPWRSRPGPGRARSGHGRGRHPGESACGPGSPTTCRPCPTPRPAPR